MTSAASSKHAAIKSSGTFYPYPTAASCAAPKSARIACRRGKSTSAPDRETGQNVKLYEATVEFQHRLYAIEAADLASNWDNTWPVFRDAIAALQFADRVVIPPDAPVVLP